MNLIVIADLTTNEGLYFRYLSMMTEADVIVETKKSLIDYYYKNLKDNGLYDFVYDIVPDEYNVEGIRLDTELDYPMTIQTNKISCSNVMQLIDQINELKTALDKI